MDADLYNEVINKINNYPGMSFNECVNTLLKKYTCGNVEIETDKVASTENRPAKISKLRLLDAIKQAAELEKIVVEEHKADGGKFYDLGELGVFTLSVRYMNGESPVYKVSETNVFYLNNYADNREKMLGKKRGELKRFLFTFCITPFNAVQWCFLDINHFEKSHKPKQAQDSIYRSPGSSQEYEDKNIGNFFYRVKTIEDIKYAEMITKKSIGEDLYNRIDSEIKKIL